ncbi:hypothetical protein V6K52_19500 [Knoellia sp. S7-12]|uniref:hypothetical protein n=1 Tax=Knoellia sp. S7-12 TaxID=3126698 RepID=UPI003365F445
MTGSRGRGNLRWALLFALTVALTLALAVALTHHLDRPTVRVVWGVVALGLLLAPVALFWILGEAHLRWSPRGRLGRALVGWSLVAVFVGVIVWCFPVGFYLFIMSLAFTFGW